MSLNILLSQKTRNVVKNINSSYHYGSSFETSFQALGQTSRPWTFLAEAPNKNVYATTWATDDIYMQTAGIGDFLPLGQIHRQYRGIGIALNGDVYVCVQGGGVYKQTAGIGGFIDLEVTARDYISMCVAPNGNIYLGAAWDDIYMQTGGAGNFNALSQTPTFPRCMTASPSGNIYFVSENSIYKQTNGVGAFTLLISYPSQYWSGISAASNNDIYACATGYYSAPDYVYKQTAEIGSFVALSQPSRVWNAITVSSNNDIYAAVGNEDIYKKSFGLNKPMGITVDNSGFIYVCDSENYKIVKLNSDLTFNSELVVSSEIGKPYCILFDSVTSDLYVVGLYKETYVSIARITTSLIVTKNNPNIYSGSQKQAYSICRAFNSTDFIITLGNVIISVTEASSSNFTTTTPVTNEIINSTESDATENRKKFLLANKPVVSVSDTFYRTLTENITLKIDNPVTNVTPKTYQISSFPIVASSELIYVENVLQHNPVDYTIDYLTGLITFVETPVGNMIAKYMPSATIFQTMHFPLLASTGTNIGTPDIDFQVYKDTVQLIYDPALSNPSNYTINASVGSLTLATPLNLTDTLQIRYRYEMISNLDYTLNSNNASVFLTSGVSQDWQNRTDKLEFNYSYTTGATTQTIIGEQTSEFTGAIKHSSGNIYFAANENNVGKIIKVDSSFTNVGSTDKISKHVIGIAECLDGSLLVYDNSNQRIARYSADLNFVEDVYVDNQIIDQPPTLLTPHNYQLSTYPIKAESEKVFAGSEILLRDTTLSIHPYSLNYSTGHLTINQINEEFNLNEGMLTTVAINPDPSITSITPNLVYQLSQHPIKDGSEQIYISGILQLSGYAINYETGRVTFTNPISGSVTASYNVYGLVFQLTKYPVEIGSINISGPYSLYLLNASTGKLTLYSAPQSMPLAWNDTTTYALDDLVLNLNDLNIYQSLQNSNINHQTSDIIWWAPYNFNVSYYRDITVTKAIYQCTGNPVQFDAYDIAGFAEANI